MAGCICERTGASHFWVPDTISYATVRSPSIGKTTVVSSYAGGAVSSLVSDSVQTGVTGNKDGRVRSIFGAAGNG